MTTDSVKELVKRLRDGDCLDIGAAADALEAMAAERDGLKAALVEQVKQYPDYSDIARKALGGGE